MAKNDEFVYPQFQREGDSAEASGGLTMRDYFAAKAMATILGFQYHSGQQAYFWGGDNESRDDDARRIAAQAYEMANAMLVAREL